MTTSNRSTSGRKSAESRANNTRIEVEYIAKVYFEFLQFQRSTGISDLRVSNQQFDSMVQSYVQLGKIKQESYNKFKSFLNNCGINPLTMTKEQFITEISNGFVKNIINVNNDTLDRLENDFYTLLSAYNIAIPDILKRALFIEMGCSISKIYKDKALNNYFEKLATNGLSKVIWKEPQVVVQESDGCSGSRTIYGDLWDNLDKLK